MPSTDKLMECAKPVVLVPNADAANSLYVLVAGLLITDPRWSLGSARPQSHCAEPSIPPEAPRPA